MGAGSGLGKSYRVLLIYNYWRFASIASDSGLATHVSSHLSHHGYRLPFTWYCLLPQAPRHSSRMPRLRGGYEAPHLLHHPALTPPRCRPNPQGYTILDWRVEFPVGAENPKHDLPLVYEKSITDIKKLEMAHHLHFLILYLGLSSILIHKDTFFFQFPICQLPFTIQGAGLAWGVHLSKQWELSPVLSFHYGIKATYQEGWSIEHCVCVHKYTMCVYTHLWQREASALHVLWNNFRLNPIHFDLWVICLFIRSIAEVNSRIKQLFANIQFPKTNVNSLNTKIYTNGFQVRHGWEVFGDDVKI